MKMMRLTTIVAGFIFLVNMAFSQDSTEVSYEMRLLGRSLGDKVELRWAPIAKETWLMGNQEGYVLQRMKYDGNGWQTVAEVKPYSLDEWKSKADTTDSYVSIAAMSQLSRSKMDIDQQNNFSQYMLAAQESDNKFAFALMAAEYSKQAAQGLGLYYMDEDIKSGETVHYRVFVKRRELPYSGDTAYMRIYTNLVYQPARVVEVTAVPGDGEIKLVWNKPQNLMHFSGYFIEKSVDGGRNFLRLNERPYVDSKVEDDGDNNYNFVDTNVINYKPYQYRIIGITPFAEEGLPSEPVKTEGIDLTGPVPPSMVWVDEYGEPGQFKVTWEATTNAPDHAGFIVGRSARAAGPFEKINTKPLGLNVREYHDKDPIDATSVYYTVFAVDDKGNENPSVIAVGIKRDSIPPAQPVGLTGNVDSVGQVMLAWEMNTEKDLKGYRVYRGNTMDHEFIQLTAGPVPGNFFFDTISLRTLTKTVYYKVVAVDYHYNPSPYSATLEISRPDYIPPASPAFTDYRVGSEGVQLNWKPSASDDAVVQGLYRKKEGEDWIILKEFDNNKSSSYFDSTAVQGSFYDYTLVAIDDAGLYSRRAEPLHIVVMDRGVRNGVSNLSGSFDKDCVCFRINWQIDSEEAHHIVVFRNENDEGLKAIATLDGGSGSYSDSDIFAFDNGYEYRLKVVYQDGGESPLSSAVRFQKK